MSDNVSVVLTDLDGVVVGDKLAVVLSVIDFVEL